MCCGYGVPAWLVDIVGLETRYYIASLSNSGREVSLLAYWDPTDSVRYIAILKLHREQTF